MGTVRYYVVTQEREITVEATDPAEAVHLATGVLGGGTPVTLEKPFASPIKVTEIKAREEY